MYSKRRVFDVGFRNSAYLPVQDHEATHKSFPMLLGLELEPASEPVLAQVLVPVLERTLERMYLNIDS